MSWWLGSRVVSVLDSAAGFMTHITCRLTAKHRDQLRNPTNRVWAAFTFFNADRK